MTSRAIDTAGQETAATQRAAGGLGLPARIAAIGAGALVVPAAAALWASEGARVFVETAFSAMLACL